MPLLSSRVFKTEQEAVKTYPINDVLIKLHLYNFSYKYFIP